MLFFVLQEKIIYLQLRVAIVNDGKFEEREYSLDLGIEGRTAKVIDCRDGKRGSEVWLRSRSFVFAVTRYAMAESGQGNCGTGPSRQ